MGSIASLKWLPFDYDCQRALYQGKLIRNNGYDFASGNAADAIAYGGLLFANRHTDYPF